MFLKKDQCLWMKISILIYIINIVYTYIVHIVDKVYNQPVKLANFITELINNFTTLLTKIWSIVETMPKCILTHYTKKVRSLAGNQNAS